VLQALFLFSNVLPCIIPLGHFFFSRISIIPETCLVVARRPGLRGTCSRFQEVSLDAERGMMDHRKISDNPGKAPDNTDDPDAVFESGQKFNERQFSAFALNNSYDAVTAAMMVRKKPWKCYKQAFPGLYLWYPRAELNRRPQV
jgi:hypothetical protein